LCALDLTVARDRAADSAIKGGVAREVCIENHRYLRALAQVVDADAYLTLSENESDGGEQTAPRGVATARGRRLGAGIVYVDVMAKQGVHAAIASSSFVACCSRRSHYPVRPDFDSTHGPFFLITAHIACYPSWLGIVEPKTPIVA
jgi:hypothetical protein